MLSPTETRLIVKTPAKKLTFPLTDIEPPEPIQEEREPILESKPAAIKPLLLPHRFSVEDSAYLRPRTRTIFITKNGKPKIFSTNDRVLFVEEPRIEIPKDNVFVPKSILKALSSLPDAGKMRILATGKTFVIQGEIEGTKYEIGTSQMETEPLNIDPLLEKEGKEIGSNWQTEELLQTVKEALKLLGKDSSWVNFREENGHLKITVKNEEKFFETELNFNVKEGTNFFLSPKFLMAGLLYLRENSELEFNVREIGDRAVSFSGGSNENRKVLIALMVPADAPKEETEEEKEE